MPIGVSYPIVKSDTIEVMGRKVIVGAVAVATILGLSAYRSLPKHLQNASPAQSATVEGALSDQRVVFLPVRKHFCR